MNAAHARQKWKLDTLDSAFGATNYSAVKWSGYNSVIRIHVIQSSSSQLVSGVSLFVWSALVDRTIVVWTPHATVMHGFEIFATINEYRGCDVASVSKMSPITHEYVYSQKDVTELGIHTVYKTVRGQDCTTYGIVHDFLRKFELKAVQGHSHHSHHLRSHHLWFPWPLAFHSRLKNTSLSQILSSISFLIPSGLPSRILNLYSTELSGHWRLFVLLSSLLYFFLVTCARLSWSCSAFESTLNSSIEPYRIVSYRIVSSLMPMESTYATSC